MTMCLVSKHYNVCVMEDEELSPLDKGMQGLLWKITERSTGEVSTHWYEDSALGALQVAMKHEEFLLEGCSKR
jgi:hypothetical protein